MDPWDAVTPDREAFATYLATLEPADWAAPSWCDGWTVKDVAAHLLVPTMGRSGVFASFVASGFNLDKMNAKYVSKLTGSMTTEQIVAKTGENCGSAHRATRPGSDRCSERTCHARHGHLALDRQAVHPAHRSLRDGGRAHEGRPACAGLPGPHCGAEPQSHRQRLGNRQRTPGRRSRPTCCSPPCRVGRRL